MNDLKDALKETLEEKGVLNEVRATIREAIYKSLENDEKRKPQLTDENLLINELIREYLRYNNYHHSVSVFTSESGQPQQPPFDRNFIAKELNVIAF
jgi:lisH domain-containing protein FOPNL